MPTHCPSPRALFAGTHTRRFSPAHFTHARTHAHTHARTRPMHYTWRHGACQVHSCVPEGCPPGLWVWPRALLCAPRMLVLGCSQRSKIVYPGTIDDTLGSTFMTAGALTKGGGRCRGCGCHILVPFRLTWHPRIQTQRQFLTKNCEDKHVNRKGSERNGPKDFEWKMGGCAGPRKPMSGRKWGLLSDDRKGVNGAGQCC